MTLTSADGKMWKAFKEKSGEENLKVADVPKGRELSSEYAANSVSSVLANLRADDAMPAKDAAPPDKAAKVRYTTFDGITVEATTWQKDNKDYAQFAASLDTAAANADIDRTQAKVKSDFDAAAKKSADEKSDAAQAEPPKPLAVSDPAKDRQQKLDALNAEVAALRKSFDGWTFVLPTYKYADMTKTLDDTLKPLETKKADAKPATKAPAKPASK